MVAVMLTLSPTARTLEVQLKVSESPLALVVVVSVSSKVFPSPCPEGSPPVSVRKPWMAKDWLGSLLSVPEMVVTLVEALLVVVLMTVKFWRLFSPVSGSSVSFVVTPLGSSVPPRKSIPRPVFWNCP